MAIIEKLKDAGNKATEKAKVAANRRDAPWWWWAVALLLIVVAAKFLALSLRF